MDEIRMAFRAFDFRSLFLFFSMLIPTYVAHDLRRFGFNFAKTNFDICFISRICIYILASIINNANILQVSELHEM